MAEQELPIPESRQDKLLHNIADGTPDISELVPQSREEVYLKYIAENGGGSGGGGDVTKEYVDQQLATKEDKDKLGTAAYCDTGTSEGNVPIINEQGKLDNSLIPSLAITDTFVAENEDEMLNLPGVEKGDICIRTDENKTYILDDKPKEVMTLAENATELSDWIELKTPTSEVTSVNGEKGDVTLTIPTVVQTRGTSTTDVMSQKAVTDSLATKVDTVEGKGLSTEDFTTEEKEKLANIPDEIPQVNIVQTTGTSETDVMSQKAVSENVCFGGGAVNTGDHSSAFGHNTNASAQYSVAIGDSSKATIASTVSVGDGSTNADYGTRRIVNVKDPVSAQDATTKNYVDNKSKKFMATVGTTWAQAETGEYTQEVEISDILETDTPIVDVVLSDDLDTAKALIEAWSCVSRVSTLDGKIKLYCYETAPTVEIPISLICIR